MTIRDDLKHEKHMSATWEKLAHANKDRAEKMELRAEAAEARAAQLQADFDAMKAAFEETTAHCLTALQERNELRAALDDIKADTMMPDGTRLSDAVKQVMKERDELAQKLEQAQARINYLECAIDSAAASEDVKLLDDAWATIEEDVTP